MKLFYLDRSQRTLTVIATGFLLALSSCRESSETKGRSTPRPTSHEPVAPEHVPLPQLCTEMDCQSSISFNLPESLIQLPNLGIRIHSQGQTGEKNCSFSISSGTKVSSASDCPQILLKTLGGELAGFELVRFEPSSMVLEVLRGTAVVHRQEVKPSYVVYRPNGDDCPPECNQATVVVGSDN